ncbi:MAG TPA: phage integrase SAM-like domain-containing protein, partial [Vicinamibacterales bacterium]|nr:phage integrase SAM-like domain-containing protein [Vicinamibacterales bacterium]
MGFSQNKSFRLQHGLYLEERKGAASYKARASLKGVTPPPFFNTETNDYARAERLARSWFRRLTADGGPQSVRTVKEAADSFLDSLSSQVRKDYHTQKWSVLSRFFAAMDLDGVTTPVLKDFVKWRKRRAAEKEQTLVPHTLRKDFVTLRRILKHAAEEGWLDKVPLFPQLERVKPNPRPWLERDDWDALVRKGAQRIADATNPRTRLQREELLDFCRFMVLTCARVDEVRALRVRDCTVRERPQDRLIATQTWSGPGPFWKTELGYPGPYLELRIHGKTGIRKCVAKDAVETFQRIVARRNLGADDLLFQSHHRDGFRELLEAA